MDKGKKIAEGTKDELKRMIKNTETVSIEVAELSEAVIDEMRELPHVYEVTYEDGKLTIRCSGGKHNLMRMLGVLQEKDIHFGRVYTELPTLNDVFLEITGKELRDKNESEEEIDDTKGKKKKR